MVIFCLFSWDYRECIAGIRASRQTKTSCVVLCFVKQHWDKECFSSAFCWGNKWRQCDLVKKPTANYSHSVRPTGAGSCSNKHALNTYNTILFHYIKQKHRGLDTTLLFVLFDTHSTFTWSIEIKTFIRTVSLILDSRKRPNEVNPSKEVFQTLVKVKEPFAVRMANTWFNTFNILGYCHGATKGCSNEGSPEKSQSSLNCAFLHQSIFKSFGVGGETQK